MAVAGRAEPGPPAGDRLRRRHVQLGDTDAGTTNRRATVYAAPSTPPNEVGVLALATPPPGQRSVVTVTDVAQVAGEPSDTRRGYLVGYRCVDVPAGAADPAATGWWPPTPGPARSVSREPAARRNLPAERRNPAQ